MTDEEQMEMFNAYYMAGYPSRKASATTKPTYAELEKENAELKCECRRCVYTDSPCILSDYGKDRNGICDHFKDVFDENAELKAKNKWYSEQVCNKECAEVWGKLTNAKEIIKELFHYIPYWIEKENDKSKVYAMPKELRAKAEQFLKEIE